MSTPTTVVGEPCQGKFTGTQNVDLVAELKVSSKSETKIVQQPPMSRDIKSQDLAVSELVMIETIPEKRTTVEAATTEDSVLPKQRRERSTALPVVEHEPLVQIETHK